MIGQTISHYAPKAHPPLADKILEKLGEVRNFLPQLFCGIENFRIPLERSESGRWGI